MLQVTAAALDGQSWQASGSSQAHATTDSGASRMRNMQQLDTNAGDKARTKHEICTQSSPCKQSAMVIPQQFVLPSTPPPPPPSATPPASSECVGRPDPDLSLPHTPVAKIDRPPQRHTATPPGVPALPQTCQYHSNPTLCSCTGMHIHTAGHRRARMGRQLSSHSRADGVNIHSSTS
jgi:hypothetical protein